MPLIELEPPSVRPWVVGIARPPLPSDGSVLNCQVKSGLNSILMNPAGTWMYGCRSGGPASSTQTVAPGSSVSRCASTEPAAPLPTMT